MGLKIKFWIPFSLVAILVGVTLSPGLLAQGERGAITGTVTDQSNAVVPQTEITVTNVATNVKNATQSMESGTYRISSLPPGIYNVEASKAGFKMASAENIRVAVGVTVKVDLQLVVGEATQRIEVTAESALLQTSPQIITDVSPQEYATWPVFIDNDQRQPLSFVFNSLPGTVGGTWSGSINGQQEMAYSILVDGVALERNYADGGSTDLTPNFESINEFSVQTGNIGSNYGGAGSAVVNFSIKSGTNQFHGSAYEYNNNSALAAKGTAFNYNKAISPENVPNPVSNHNNFGASIGGPIKKDKAFFFFTYEGSRSKYSSSSGMMTIPTLAWRKGDFSDMLGSQLGVDVLGRPVYDGEIFDPATMRQVDGQWVRDPFMYGGKMNVIDPARFSGVSKKILELYPDPVNSDNRRNYPAATYSANTLNQYGVKGDYIINSKHRMNAYVSLGHHNIDLPMGGQFLPIDNPMNQFHTEYDHPTIVRLSEDWTVNSSMNNHFSFGYNRMYLTSKSISYNQGWPEKLGLKGVDLNQTFPSVVFSGNNGIDLTTLGDGYAFGTASGSWILKDDFIWVRGKHTLQTGFEFRRYNYSDHGYGYLSGYFAFDQGATQAPDIYGTGHQFASFLLGDTSWTWMPVYGPKPTYLNNYPALYFQDEFKLTPKLTLSAGLRWEIPLPRYEKHNYTSGFDPNVPNPGADGYKGALVWVADQGRKSFQNTYYREFAPNLGIAYSINDKTVLRTGYSLTYSPPSARAYGFNENFGYYAENNLSPSQLNLPSTYDPAFNWDTTYPAFTKTLPVKDPSLQNYGYINWTLPGLAQPYIQTWNLGLQRELIKETQLEVKYVGNKGTHLPTGDGNRASGQLSSLINQLDPKYLALGDLLLQNIDDQNQIAKPYPSFQGTVSQALRPYPQYTGMAMTGYNIGCSTYHSMQIQARKRPKKGGLGFIASYTFSKSLNDSGSNSIGYNYNFQNFYNRKDEKALATFNMPHVFKLSWIWELPFGKGRALMNRGGVLNAVAGGWSLTGIQSYSSGTPLAITDWSLYVPSGGVLRPDRVPGVPVYQKSDGYDLANGSTWFNPAAFAHVPSSLGGVPLHLGNAARVLDIYNPWNASETISFFKTFTLKEGMTLQIRADASNIFNRTYRWGPVTDMSSPDFGKIMGADGYRTVQVSGRFQF